MQLVEVPGPEVMTRTLSRKTRETLYRHYMEFFERANGRRSWTPFADIPWELADPSLNDPERALNVETFCAIEHFLPDYVSTGLNCVRDCFGQAWFQVQWGYEEARHATSLRMYLERTGQRTNEQLFDLEERMSGKTWLLPFRTPRRMTAYGSLQEASTHLAYRRLLANAKEDGDALLVEVVRRIALDEGAHQGFYRRVLKVELEEDREATLEDLAHVWLNFKMPVWDLFDESEVVERHASLKAHHAFDAWGFRIKVWNPLIQYLDVPKREMNEVVRRVREREERAAMEGDLPLG